MDHEPDTPANSHGTDTAARTDGGPPASTPADERAGETVADGRGADAHPIDDALCTDASDVLDRLERRHAMATLCAVGAGGPLRYGAIEESLPQANSATLSARLSELVEAGYLTREEIPQVPPRVEYDLTPAGSALCERLRPLLEWAASADEAPDDAR